MESAVVHYGDITLTFLCNLDRADERGTAMSYVSAIAVEENSVTNYNDGNCDGVSGWEPRLGGRAAAHPGRRDLPQGEYFLSPTTRSSC